MSDTHVVCAVSHWNPEVPEITGADQAIARPRRFIRRGGATLDRERNARLHAAQRQRGRESFDAHLWRFVVGAPRVNRWRTLRKVPARTRESDALSRDMQANISSDTC